MISTDGTELAATEQHPYDARRPALGFVGNQETQTRISFRRASRARREDGRMPTKAGEPRQRLLYLHARTPNVFSDIVGLTQIEPAHIDAGEDQTEGCPFGTRPASFRLPVGESVEYTPISPGGGCFGVGHADVGMAVARLVHGRLLRAAHGSAA